MSSACHANSSSRKHRCWSWRDAGPITLAPRVIQNAVAAKTDRSLRWSHCCNSIQLLLCVCTREKERETAKNKERAPRGPVDGHKWAARCCENKQEDTQPLACPLGFAAAKFPATGAATMSCLPHHDQPPSLQGGGHTGRPLTKWAVVASKFTATCCCSSQLA